MVARSRRLAAIMFTDIAGYTSLAQRDERGALKAVAEQEELARSAVRRRSGRRVKSTGDGLLVEFPDALDAVEAAVDLQRLVAERTGAGRLPRFELRIAVHLGDVQGAGADILGDAVNIAARVLPLAQPGGICVSAQVHDQVRNKVDLRFESMGPQLLKGVERPVEVFRVSGPRVAPPPGKTPGSILPRIAVLPLANISPDPADEYFADGLTEELITVLSRVPGLQVIARTSVLPYKANPKPIAQIGAELNVTSVLEGSVRKVGDQVRISVQLIDSGSQGHTWAQTYDRTLTDIFAVQSDIAARTAEALRVELAGPASAGDRAHGTVVPRAYELYLQGLVASRSLEEGGPNRAFACFERATQVDPTFASAYAAWANLYVMLAGDAFRVREVLPKAKALATRALELDPESSEAHAALGNIALQFDLDWSGSEAEFARALALNPSNVNALRFQSMLFQAVGRLDDAREAANLAATLDPGVAERNLAWIELQAGHFDRAIAYREAEVHAHPDSPGAHHYLGFAYLQAKRLSEARRAARWPLPRGASPNDRFDHALLRAAVGQPSEGREAVRAIAAGTFGTYVSPCYLAMLYACLGNLDLALDALERDFREGDRMLWLVHRTSFFDPIRERPRFRALLRRYRLPPSATAGPGAGVRAASTRKVVRRPSPRRPARRSRPRGTAAPRRLPSTGAATVRGGTSSRSTSRRARPG